MNNNNNLGFQNINSSSINKENNDIIIIIKN